MNKIIATSALTILLAACGQDNTATQSAGTAAPAADVKVEKYSGLKPENMNRDVRPGDDFNSRVDWSESLSLS